MIDDRLGGKVTDTLDRANPWCWPRPIGSPSDPSAADAWAEGFAAGRAAYDEVVAQRDAARANEEGCLLAERATADALAAAEARVRELEAERDKLVVECECWEETHTATVRALTGGTR